MYIMAILLIRLGIPNAAMHKLIVAMYVPTTIIKAILRCDIA